MDLLIAALLEHRSTWLLTAWLIGFFGLGVLEVLRPRRLDQNEPDSRWLSHVSLVFINAGLIELTFGGAFMAASHPTGVLPIGVLAGDSLLADIVLGVLAADLLGYWVHRLHHTLSPLWRLHALHHSDDRLDVTTSFRNHPGEVVVGGAIVWAAHGLFGASVAAVVVYGVLKAIASPMQHANLHFPPRLERALEWLFVTNAAHLIHHSVDLRDGNANFGTLFSIWDRLFGTWRAPAQGEDIRSGLDEVQPKTCDSLPAMLLLPVRSSERR